ncbi:MAG: hypothetical protein V4621_06430 [Pseudomonadota bacterium]
MIPLVTPKQLSFARQQLVKPLRGQWTCHRMNAASLQEIATYFLYKMSLMDQDIDTRMNEDTTARLRYVFNTLQRDHSPHLTAFQTAFYSETRRELEVPPQELSRRARRNVHGTTVGVLMPDHQDRCGPSLAFFGAAVNTLVPYRSLDKADRVVLEGLMIRTRIQFDPKLAASVAIIKECMMDNVPLVAASAENHTAKIYRFPAAARQAQLD